ncbi:MAG: hypothetical protein RL588_2658 [Pseudomonadota bacterium]|jgi:Skp family chaperone for outer membrane proteins
MTCNRPLLAAMTAALLLAAPAALAQASPSRPSAEIADQDRRSEALNAAVNARNAEIAERNAKTARDAATADAEYKARMDEWSARNAEAQAQAEAWDRAQAEWKAQVAACRAGVRSRCGPPPKLTNSSER